MALAARHGPRGLIRASGPRPHQRLAVPVALRRRADDGSAAVARLRSGVIARIRECDPASAWCEVQVASHRGYIRRADVWGLLPEEEIR